MKNFIFVIFLLTLSFGCKKQSKIELKFLDEFVLADSLQFKNTIIGGLSGIDYANQKFYFVVDDARKPRFLTANISIKNDTINNISFKDVFHLKDSTELYYKENALDLESIFVNEKTQEINFISEGSIRKNKKPLVFKTTLTGDFLADFKMPKSFKKLENIKHNAVFEASSRSVKNNGFWIAMEGVLKSDGREPTFKKTKSPIRITYFNNKINIATKQFAYQLDSITKSAKGNINLNGVTAILEYKENSFFIVERTYQNGYGAYGNTIKIYNAYIDKETTNIIDYTSLKEANYIPLKKKLLFNFESVKSKLTEGIIDNIEGITFGPKLSNGNQSLVLVSDDNFQIYGKQLNQFILLEIKNK